ncbi:unnamed protein product, partial [Symbiodinium sp. KB8]
MNARTPNIVIPLSSFSGGELRVSGATESTLDSAPPSSQFVDLPVASGPVTFNARDCPHEVLPSQGRRVVLAAYTLQAAFNLDAYPELRSSLTALAFPLPPADRLHSPEDLVPQVLRLSPEQQALLPSSSSAAEVADLASSTQHAASSCTAGGDLGSLLGPCRLPGPTPRLFLDLFAGARAPVSSVLRDMGLDCFPAVDIIVDASCNILDDAFFNMLCRIADAGLVGAALAAPVCSKHSILRLRPGGPKPLRDFAFPTGRPDLNWEDTAQLQESALLHDRSRILLSRVSAFGGLILLENPASSLTFHDPLMMSWIESEVPIPPSLENAMDPAFSVGALLNILTNWRLPWPVCASPSLLSLARAPHFPAGGLYFRIILRGPCIHAGSKMVAAPTVLHAGFSPHQTMCCMTFAIGGRVVFLTLVYEPPLSDSAVEPFMQDLFEALQVPPAARADLLFIAPGQPLRLRLLKFLLSKLRDPEAAFCDQLESGVSLGVGSVLEPSSHWPTRDAEHIIPDLHIREGTWQSAESQPDIVNSLLDEELREEWISEYASLEDIQSEFSQVALGRLGLVIAEGRSARLVVDSSISGVTSSSAIPNCISNPRIEDVSACAPSYVPPDPWVGASIDVKKAHRRMLIAKQERDKVHRILHQITALSTQTKVKVKDLESLIGRLLWLTGLWRLLRPLLQPLYAALRDIPCTLIAVSPQLWTQIIASCDDSGRLTRSLNHASFPEGARITRAGNNALSSLSQMKKVPFIKRRLWVSVQDSEHPLRCLSPAAVGAMQSWHSILNADAFADQDQCGLGGYILVKEFFPSLDGPLQHHICALELLAQYCLLWIASEMLPRARHHLTLPMRSDNSGAELVSAKGLTSVKVLGEVLRAFLDFQRRNGLHASVEHIPGYRNDLADELSRLK